MKTRFEGGFAIDGGECRIYKEGIVTVGQFDTYTSNIDIRTWDGEKLGWDLKPYRPGDGGFTDMGNGLILGPWWDFPTPNGWTEGWPDEMPDGEPWPDWTNDEAEAFIRAMVN